MIVFYNKKTGQIYGTLNGYNHDDNQIENVLIKPSDVKKTDVGKEVVKEASFKEAGFNGCKLSGLIVKFKNGKFDSISRIV